jgi:RNA polymerase sigma factor (sigma-70 family)
MNERDWLVEHFEEHRPHLRAVAYRMLGSLAEADEAVQDAWLRVSRAGADGIDNFRGWLTTIVARVCLNVLQARKARPEDAGVHLPDPIVKREDALDPEDEVLMADSLGLALQIVLDTLPPAERLAFGLHDMFDVPFEEIGPMAGRSATATRSSPAVRGGACKVHPCRLQTRTSLVNDRSSMRSSPRRIAATLTRSWQCWIPTWCCEGMAEKKRPGLSVIRRGAAEVARTTVTSAQPAAVKIPVLVNGAAGVVVMTNGRPFAVMGFTVARGKIVEIDCFLDPDRLAHLDLAVAGDKP